MLTILTIRNLVILYKRIEQLIDKKLQRKADNSLLQIDHNLAYYLFTWRRINYEATKNYVNQLLETKQGIIDYLTGGLSSHIYNNENRKNDEHQTIKIDTK